MNQSQLADRNIRLYVIVRIFAKRVFLPLAAIYFMATAGFSLREIGLLSAFFSIVQFVAEIPTGYFADKIGRVMSLRLGGLLAAIATTIYVFIHSKSGIYVGVMFEALGYSFLGGAGEALIHDSLAVKKQTHLYTKILSQTMSVSLIANAILVTLIPLTYVWNKTYPFALGTLAYLILVFISFFMRDVDREIAIKSKSSISFKQISGKKYILAFGLTFGIVAALYTNTADTLNVALTIFGLDPSKIGVVYGLASVLGAIIGPFFHYLRRIKLSHYVILDLCILTTLYLSGFTGNAYILATFMIINISFWRYRKIIYQDHLLATYPTSYKATLISTLNNIEELNSIWLPVFITYLVTLTSLTIGFGIMALFVAVMAPLYYFSTIKFFAKKPTIVV